MQTLPTMPPPSAPPVPPPPIPPPPQPTAPPTRKRFERVVCAEDGIDLVVYPLSYRELEAHADAVAFILQAASKVEAARIVNSAADGGAALWSLLAPLCGREILRLLNDCCVPTLADAYAPPDVVAEAAAKWVALSFLRPGSFDRVMSAAEGLATAATGTRVDLRGRWRSSFASATRGPTSTGASGSTVTPPAAGGPPPSSSNTSAPPGP